MKEWWLNLSLREKETISLGAFALVILGIYIFIWSPLTNKVTSLREQIERDSQLLKWMQSADQQIESAEKTAKTTKNSGSLLSIAQTLIQESALSSQLTQLRQTDADSVQLSFKEVSFDTLIVWLAESSKKEHLLISEFRVTPLSTPGMVSAELTFKSS